MRESYRHGVTTHKTVLRITFGTYMEALGMMGRLQIIVELSPVGGAHISTHLLYTVLFAMGNIINDGATYTLHI